MKIVGSIALVTGANRGLGLAFARALLERGAAKVYAGARDPASVKLAGVVPIKLDVTRDDDVAAAARQAPDVNLLINNAGIARFGAFLGDGAIEASREHFEVNVLGPLRMARAFAPVLAQNGGGGILNVLSGGKLDQRTAACDLWGVEIGRLGADERSAHRARRAGHPGSWSSRRFHRHRYDPGRHGA